MSHFNSSKALDSLNHCQLLIKLQSFGIRYYVHYLMKVSLARYTLYVKIWDRRPDKLEVASRAPEWLVLGPRSFLPLIKGQDPLKYHPAVPWPPVSRW